MKKIVSVVLGVALSIGVAACGKNGEVPAPGNDVSLLNADDAVDSNLTAIDNALPSEETAIDNTGGDVLHDNVVDHGGNITH